MGNTDKIRGQSNIIWDLLEVIAPFLAFWNGLPGAAGCDLRAVKDSQLELISYCTEHQTIMQSKADPDLTFSPPVSPSSSQTAASQMQWASFQIMQNIPRDCLAWCTSTELPSAAKDHPWGVLEFTGEATGRISLQILIYSGLAHSKVESVLFCLPLLISSNTLRDWQCLQAGASGARLVEINCPRSGSRWWAESENESAASSATALQ